MAPRPCPSFPLLAERQAYHDDLEATAPRRRSLDVALARFTTAYPVLFKSSGPSLVNMWLKLGEADLAVDARAAAVDSSRRRSGGSRR